MHLFSAVSLLICLVSPLVVGGVALIVGAVV